MGQRKVIQIAVAEYGSESQSESDSSSMWGRTLIALCNDGTIWEINDRFDKHQWYPIPPIPQENKICTCVREHDPKCPIHE